jgi:DNA-directed RNA polymerase specialized sigma24 family protein
MYQQPHRWLCLTEAFIDRRRAERTFVDRKMMLMHILVLHRVPDTLVRYADAIDHGVHEVTYVGVPDRLPTMPADVPARRIVRPGTRETSAEVLAAIEGLPAPERVIALSEYDLLAAARVREVLGVPGGNVADVLPVRDKVAMKAAITAAGLRAPRFLDLRTAVTGGPATVSWTGPTVLKPRAGASSEGVRRFPTVQAALAAALSAQTPFDIDDLEVEEFVEGPIIHVDGLVADGAPVAVQTSRYVNTCLGFAAGAPLGSIQVHTTPEVVEWTLRCLSAVGITTGPFHLEAFETPEGMVFLEVGARFGGADVVDTFELATGARLPAAQLRLLVDGPGTPLAVGTPRPGQQYGWFVWPGHTLGTKYCRITGEAAFRDDPLVWRWVQRRPHEAVSGDITYADAHVPLAGVVGPGTPEELARLLTEMFAAITVTPDGHPTVADSELVAAEGGS